MWAAHTHTRHLLDCLQKYEGILSPELRANLAFATHMTFFLSLSTLLFLHTQYKVQLFVRACQA